MNWSAFIGVVAIAIAAVALGYDLGVDSGVRHCVDIIDDAIEELEAQREKFKEDEHGPKQKD